MSFIKMYGRCYQKFNNIPNQDLEIPQEQPVLVYPTEVIINGSSYASEGSNDYTLSYDKEYNAELLEVEWELIVPNSVPDAHFENENPQDNISLEDQSNTGVSIYVSNSEQGLLNGHYTVQATLNCVCKFKENITINGTKNISVTVSSVHMGGMGDLHG